MFTRQHYEAIADTIRPMIQGRANFPEQFDTMENVALELAVTFHNDNPAFKAERFFQRAGVPNVDGLVNEFSKL